ncbi:hypothetical protein [Flexivirga caeni]|uniref:Cell division protein FtsL n=1 Tax=Flexivirga caeni TaxID=2294115 RepID=A0A3M9M6T5_9MICO|nr:hypothetical protein [Flexivirga caeni]RNI20258.1 hypothetical protein EFY87_14970 [Flexivirga caeni]
MSQLTALPRPASRADRPTRPARPAAQPPRLRVVEAKDAAEHTGVGFVLLCVLLLVGGLIGLLLLNTDRAQESFAAQNLQSQSSSLTDQQQALSGDIDAMSAPQQLALQAQRMGLVQATTTRFVRASDGKLLGVAKRSAKDSALTVETLPTTPASQVAAEAVSAASSGLLVTKPKPASKHHPAAAKSKAGTASGKAAKKSEKHGTATTSAKDRKAEKPTTGTPTATSSPSLTTPAN